MKALVRNKGETVRESDGIEGIDWNTGAPLTSEHWADGPYQLIQNWVEPVIQEPDPVEIIEEPSQPAEETVTINGKTYTKAELRNILNS